MQIPFYLSFATNIGLNKAFKADYDLTAKRAADALKSYISQKPDLPSASKTQILKPEYSVYQNMLNNAETSQKSENMLDMYINKVNEQKPNNLIDNGGESGIIKGEKTNSIAKNSVNNSKKMDTSKLVVTHKPTLSKKQYNSLLNDIGENGIKESIKYIEYKGKNYVVDGHHRLKAAKELKIDKVPVEKVSLPYKGYKTINDLLWYD